MSKKSTNNHLVAGTAKASGNITLKKSTARPVASMNVQSPGRNLQKPVLFAKMSPQSGGQKAMPNHERNLDAEATDNRLKKKSPWYASLRDPMRGGGAKIPDTVGINTATMQLVQRVSVAVNAQGVAGLEVISPYINSTQSGSTSGNYKTSASTSASGALTWNTIASFSNAASLKSVAQNHRIVSGAVFGEYEGTTLNDSGDVTSYLYPYTPNALTQLSTIQTLYGSSVIPINKARTKPVVSRWFPVNVNEQSYKDFFSPNIGTFGEGACPNWTMGLIYQGLPAGVGSVIFTMVYNYEFIPSLNTIDYISADPSPIDPIEEQLVQQWVQEDTQTGLSSNKLVDVQPGSQVVEAADQGINADSGFGMLGSIIKEVAPLVIPMLL